MTRTGDNVTKAPTGYITVNDRPMAFWLPAGADASWASGAPCKQRMEPEDIGLMDDSDDPEPGADDSVNDLVDEVQR